MSSDAGSKCFTSAAAGLKGPPGYFTSGAFSNLRWTLAGDQRDERMRLFCRKLLARLDGMEMPFYPAVGLMNRQVAQQRYVTHVDPWPPISSPFLDGSAIRFRHCILPELSKRQWALFAEVGFDVARLAQIPVAWGGFSAYRDPGYWELADAPCAELIIDGRTYGSRLKHRIDYVVE